MRVLVAVVLLGVWPIRVIGAQWHVGLEVATVQYHGTSRDTSGPGGAHIRPDHAALYGLRVGRQFGRIDVAVRALTGNPGIAGAAPGVTITDKSTGRLLEIVPLVGVRLARLGAGGTVGAEAGPAIGVWDIDGEMRARVAALGALVYDWPVVGRLRGSIRAEGTLRASIFDAAELPPELERRPTWRYGVTLGLRYRL